MLHGSVDGPDHNECGTNVQSPQRLLHFIRSDISFPASVVEESSNADKYHDNNELQNQGHLHEYVSEVLCRLLLYIRVREKRNTHGVENFNDGRDGSKCREGTTRMKRREIGNVVQDATEDVIIREF